MIEVQDKPDTDAFEDAVQATTFIATVHVRHGELTLPKRIREHIADGDVVVHLVRGTDDESRQTATLTGSSKVVGIEWPADIKPRMTLKVMCPRGAESHDVAVQLPDLPEPLHFVVVEEPAAEPEPDEDDESDAALDDLPPDPWAEPAVWPGDESAAEPTELFPAVGTLDVELASEPVAVKPSRVRAWLALALFYVVARFAVLVDAVTVRIENVSQSAMDHARVIAKVICAILAAVILVVTAYLSLRGVA